MNIQTSDIVTQLLAVAYTLPAHTKVREVMEVCASRLQTQERMLLHEIEANGSLEKTSRYLAKSGNVYRDQLHRFAQFLAGSGYRVLARECVSNLNVADEKVEEIRKELA